MTITMMYPGNECMSSVVGGVTVSVLIATYNRAGFLRQALRSALVQTYNNIEIIVLDDFSSDETPAVVTEFTTDDRLRYIRHQQNRGIVCNWQAGIKAAKGKYFCLLHDDDIIEPTFIERLLAPLEDDDDLILSFCDHWVMDQNGTRLPHESDATSYRFGRHMLLPGHLQNFARAALVDYSVPVGATVFRRSLIAPEYVHEEAKGAIDAWLLYQCVKTGHGAYYIPERLMNYRAHPGGMSTSALLYMSDGHLFRYRAILADTEMAALHPDIVRLMAETLVSRGIYLVRTGQRREARQSLREALRMDWSLRPIVAYALACGGGVGTRLAKRLSRIKLV